MGDNERALSNPAALARSTQANLGTWRRGAFLSEYDTRRLRPPEARILIDHRDELRGRLLELGPGAGRLTFYLLRLGSEVHGIDLSPAMIEHCRSTLPAGVFHLGDFTDLSGFEDGSLAAVLAPCNVVDVLDDVARRALLDDLHRVIEPGGLLVMSSHNRGYVPSLRTPWRLRMRDPLRFGYDLVKLPRRVRNRRRLVGLESAGADHQIVNDGAHDFSLLHYFIARDDQQCQLERHGFDLLECLDLRGEPVAPGADAPGCVELHYVARRRADS